MEMFAPSCLRTAGCGMLTQVPGGGSAARVREGTEQRWPSTRRRSGSRSTDQKQGTPAGKTKSAVFRGRR